MKLQVVIIILIIFFTKNDGLQLGRKFVTNFAFIHYKQMNSESPTTDNPGQTSGIVYSSTYEESESIDSLLNARILYKRLNSLSPNPLVIGQTGDNDYSTMFEEGDSIDPLQNVHTLYKRDNNDTLPLNTVGTGDTDYSTMYEESESIDPLPSSTVNDHRYMEESTFWLIMIVAVLFGLLVLTVIIGGAAVFMFLYT